MEGFNPAPDPKEQRRPPSLGEVAVVEGTREKKRLQESGLHQGEPEVF